MTQTLTPPAAPRTLLPAAWHTPALSLHLTSPKAAPLTLSQARAWATAPGTFLIGAVGFHPDDPTCFRPALPGPRSFGAPHPAPAAHLTRAASRPSPTLFEANVSRAATAIGAGDLHKAVLGRTLELTLGYAPDPQEVAARLAMHDPDAFVFSLPLDAAGSSWLVGASPELLLRKTGATLHLRPLAGTRARHSDPAEDLRRGQELLYSAKDRQEHSLMIGEIRQVLTPLCHKLDIPANPQLAHTAGLWHLATPIRAELRDPQQHILDLVQIVHPTPAVCGVPTGAARRLIAELEPARGYFAGAVGWCNEKGDGEWAVTIRCARLNGEMAYLFAGAGVVQGSDPAGERAETAAKFGVILRALGIEPRDLEGAL